jgi:co-chaperonin GroES (HSP10)
VKYLPTADNVLVRYVKPDAKTPAGIVLPDAAQERQRHAEVLAVGPGLPRPCDGAVVPVALQKGDRVVIHPGAGATPVPAFAGDTAHGLALVSERAVLAVVAAY